MTLAALAAALCAMLAPVGASASPVQWRPAQDTLGNPGGGVYLTNNHSGYYMGRLFKREMFGVHDYKNSRGFGARVMDDGRVYRWGNALGAVDECLWIGPAGNGDGGAEYLGRVDGRTGATCSREQMRALEVRDNFGSDFNCSANAAVGPQRTTLARDAAFYYNVRWERRGERYSAPHVSSRASAVIPAGSTIWYRYTTRGGDKAVVFARSATGEDLGWGFVDADTVNMPDRQHWTLAGSTGQEWTCGTALEATGRHWRDTVGVAHMPGFLLTDDNAKVHYVSAQFDMLLSGDRPVAGDFDGDGRDEAGVYRAPYFYLPTSNQPGAPLRIVRFGQPGDLPVVGDWDGDGVDTVAVYRAPYFWMSDTHALAPGVVTEAALTRTAALGDAGDVPLAGRWTKDQDADTPAVYRAPNFYFSASTGDPTRPYTQAAHSVRFGGVGDVPVAGDWDNKGHDSIGVYRAPYFLLRNSNTSGDADSVIEFGSEGDLPVVGDWDGR